MGQARLPPDRDPEPRREDGTVEVLDQGQEAEPGKRRRLTAFAPSKSPSALHRFCLFEFPFAPGPGDGRYLVRGAGDAADVIVVKSLGAPVKRGRARPALGRRKPSRAEAGADEVEPVSITQATVIRGLALDDTAAAQEWLAACARAETAESEVEEALRLLNRAIQAHRVSAADPYTGDVSRAHARRVRIGYGTGDELVEGRWREALDLPPTTGRGRRRRMLGPEEQVAQILGGRRPIYPSEELLLRTRLDLDQGRARQAAMQARAARAALEAELRSEEKLDEFRAALQGGAGFLDDLAATALERELDADQATQLAEVVVEMERIARRRRHLVEHH